MVNYSHYILPELLDLTINDKERILQALHIAFADKLTSVQIELREFRGGEEVLYLRDFEFSELYNAIGGSS